MKTVLVLVLSIEQLPYGKLCDTSLATWDSVEVPGVETVFYFGDTARTGDKFLNTHAGEDYWAMGHKTLLAFEYALVSRQFDYVFRANASLYIDKRGLAKYCLDKPETGLALGVVADCGMFEGERFSFLWGPSYMLSRDVVQKVVDNQGRWNHRLTDDNAISRLLHAINVPLDNRGSMASIAINDNAYEFVYYENGVSGGATLQSLNELPRALPNQFCFRVKDDADRTNDIRLMHELHAAFTT